MSFPRYPAYKDSGIEWLGEVPSHWAVLRLGQIGRLSKGNGGTKQDETDAGVPCVRYGDLYTTHRYFIRGSRSCISPERAPDYTSIQCGDVLFAASGETIEEIGKSAVNLLESEAVCGGDVIVLRPTATVEPLFLGFALDSPEANAQKAGMGRGFTVVHIYADQLRTLGIAFPSLSEQSAIGTFLDRETAKIDALVAEYRTLIELLKEKRQAVISHAVTKGLDPTVPMKDSGVEWLGEVPEHWEVMRLSAISDKITNGYVGPTRDILVDDGIRYLQSLHIKGNSIKFDPPYQVTEEWSQGHAKSILAADDVLIVQTGDIGQVAVVPDEFAGCNCHALIIVSPTRRYATGEWMSLVLNSDYGFHSLLSIRTGALHPHLNCGNVKDLFLPLPGLPEQEAIATHVRAETAKLDALVAEAEQAISLLQERRTALISAAVTGKIDVRGLVQQEAA